jgi:hypothetical protein
VTTLPVDPLGASGSGQPGLGLIEFLKEKLPNRYLGATYVVAGGSVENVVVAAASTKPREIVIDETEAIAMERL